MIGGEATPIALPEILDQTDRVGPESRKSSINTESPLRGIHAFQ